MGRKSRRRSGHQASAPARRNSAAKQTRRSTAVNARARADAAELFESTVDELWGTIASGDVLKAEMQTSVFASMMLVADSSGVVGEEFSAALIESVIDGELTPESAAFCRLLMSLGLPGVKPEASRALEEHTDEGVYPPDWVRDAGRPVPLRAWRSHSVFGDDEFFVIAFGYGEVEHAIVVGLDLTELPAVSILSVGPDPDELIKIIRERDQQFAHFEEITLPEARRRIEGPLAHADEDLDPDVNHSSFMCIPLIRSRIRRLPAGSPDAEVTYTAADRAAAVADFLRSPLAASAGDADTARFWAEVLTGYSGRVTGEPPAQVGPVKLGAALLLHAASTFTLTDPQRAGLRPAATAWSRWAAGRQGLDEAAIAHVLEHLEKVLDNFESAYNDPRSIAARGYVRDLALASDVDVAWLAGCRARREFAVPLPEHRERGREVLDAGDHDHRVVICLSEFGMCDTGGMPREEFVRAVRRVAGELWDDDPPQTWQAARRMSAEGMSRHQIVHALAEL